MAGILISAVLPGTSDAFLSGAPRPPRSNASPSSQSDSKTKVDDLGSPPVMEDTVGPR